MFLLADAAIVGHIGTRELAGLGIAGAIIQTAVGLCVFLAYGTTASVSRRIGSGDLPGAISQGSDGNRLAAIIGTATPLVGISTTPWLVRPLGARRRMRRTAG